jgi:hypothetical protein
MCSGLLWVTSRTVEQGDARARRPWAALSAIFLFLAIDEFASLHEMLTTPTKHLLSGTSGFFHFAWIIPYGIACLIIGVAFLRFFINLPPSIRMGFFLSGTVYLSGAVGFEMLGSAFVDARGGDNAIYALIYSTEELLEMLGASVFIFTLLKGLSRYPGTMEIQF